MPRYFIDTDDGQLLVRDEEGLDLPDLEAARSEAVISLPGIARGAIKSGNLCPITSSIRDASGTVLFEATLDLTEHWMANPGTKAWVDMKPYIVEKHFTSKVPASNDL